MSILAHFLMKICRIKATKRRFDKKISQDFQVFFFFVVVVYLPYN